MLEIFESWQQQTSHIIPHRVKLRASLLEQVNHCLFCAFALLPLQTDLILDTGADVFDAVEKYLLTFFAHAFLFGQLILDAHEFVLNLLQNHFFCLLAVFDALLEPVVQVGDVFFQVLLH